MRRKEIEIVNRLGLHARAAAKLVSCASGFASRIEVSATASGSTARASWG